jgi:hypothetical protein
MSSHQPARLLTHTFCKTAKNLDQLTDAAILSLSLSLSLSTTKKNHSFWQSDGLFSKGIQTANW